MQHLFSADKYTQRRSTLANTVKSGVILITGNSEAPMNYLANPYRFRQDSTFLYYAGLQSPDLHLVIDTVSGESTLYGNEFTMADTIWSGPQELLSSQAERVGVLHLKPLDSIVEDIHDKEIHCLPPYRTEHFRLLQKITNRCDCSLAPSQDLIHAVIAQREIKDGDEIAQMEHALAITAQMHTKVIASTRPGMKEQALAGIAQGIAAAGGGAPAYGIIMTKNGEVLHNHEHGNTLAEGDLVLGDFGAENAMCYAGDITRTWPVSKTFTPQQKDIYEIVLDAQVKAINACRAGQAFRDVHLLAARIIADGLSAHGLMKGDPEEAVSAGAHALFFPHGLGHMIGLDVHDMEGLGEDNVGYGDAFERSEQFGLAYLRMAKPLKEGHVITVEPGIYFIPPLIDQWKEEDKHTDFINYEALEAFRDFGGIRIEDNILVTASGPRVLGPPIPKTINDVEALRT